MSILQAAVVAILSALACASEDEVSEDTLYLAAGCDQDTFQTTLAAMEDDGLIEQGDEGICLSFKGLDIVTSPDFAA